MANELAELQASAKKNAEGLDVLTKQLGAVVDRLSKTPDPRHPSASDVFGLPNARTGESAMNSRRFSYLKMFAVLNNVLPAEQAKVEIDVHNRLHNAFFGKQNGYIYGAAGGMAGMNKFLAPLCADYLPEDFIEPAFRHEIKSLTTGVQSDPDESRWIQTKMYGQKAMSWLNELSGGSLVPPAEQGELIELLRNKEALVNAGARTVPLPPQGRLKYPRQTLASNTFWVGESAPITDSTLGTGEVTLQAKKLAVLIKSPNELIRFASPAAEALLRDDMTKSLALGLDLAGLEGQGGDHRPRGLINMPNINKVTSSDARANGDKLIGQDMYRMIAVIEESNAECTGFIMRPKTLYKTYQLRADAVAQGDSQGPFLFNLIREAGDGVKPAIGGHPVTTSTQISQVVSKGTSSALTYILSGMWNELLIGMFGAIEFAATTLGDTAFVNDQTWVRGILTADIAARHEAAFAILSNIDTTL